MDAFNTSFHEVCGHSDNAGTWFCKEGESRKVSTKEVIGHTTLKVRLLDLMGSVQHEID